MNQAAISPLRAHLLACFRAALARVHGRRCVAEALQSTPLDGPVHLVAVGKAASAMTLGALDVLGEQVTAGLVVTKDGHLDPVLARWSMLQTLEAGHPVPDPRSLAAGTALVEFVDGAPGEARFLFLLSGGTSSLVEVLAPGCGLQDLERVNRWLLGSGLAIDQVNAVRKAVSCIKGGRLGNHLGGRSARVLLISDVPGDDPAVIGSGLLVPAPAPLPETLPPWLEKLIGAAPPVPRGPLAGVEVELVARPADARAAAAEHAGQLGYTVHCHEQPLAGEAAAVGRICARCVREGAPGLHVWGGETTVTLPARPGRGGRSQMLALAAARELADLPGVALLAAGTDGSDGPTEDAGAVVDGCTVRRGQQEGLDPGRCLREADAGRFLEASGDLVQTGPTGTNVMDLVLAVRLQAAQSP